MAHEDPIGRQRGDSFVRTVARLCIGGAVLLVAIVSYTLWTRLVA